MRHFTEYEGLRPSILAQTVALECPTVWFSFTSGVLPILRELSSNLIMSAFTQVFRSYMPILDRQCGDCNSHSIVPTVS